MQTQTRKRPPRANANPDREISQLVQVTAFAGSRQSARVTFLLARALAFISSHPTKIRFNNNIFFCRCCCCCCFVFAVPFLFATSARPPARPLACSSHLFTRLPACLAARQQSEPLSICNSLIPLSSSSSFYFLPLPPPPPPLASAVQTPLTVKMAHAGGAGIAL